MKFCKGLLIALMMMIGLSSENVMEAEKELQYKIVERVEYKEMEVEVSWYTSDVRETDSTPFIAASGVRVFDGLVAISPDLLDTFAYGDSIYVDGRWLEIQDRMNKRYTKTIDIWCTSREEAFKNGRQRMLITWDYNTIEDIIFIE